MARKVIPGIYIITNTNNGKVYIGQSKDILKRFRQYFWAVTSDCDYDQTRQPIVNIMRDEGIENFTFEILKTGNKYTDQLLRMIDEMKYIAKYKSFDPEYGYNESRGGEYNSSYSRQQSFIERLHRATPAFLYNIETQNVQLYFFGAKAIADEFNCDKAITSHAMNRCDVFADKYFIIPAEYDERHRLYDKKLISFNEIHSNPKYPNRTITKLIINVIDLRKLLNTLIKLQSNSATQQVIKMDYLFTPGSVTLGGLALRCLATTRS